MSAEQILFIQKQLITIFKELSSLKTMYQEILSSICSQNAVFDDIKKLCLE